MRQAVYNYKKWYVPFHLIRSAWKHLNTPPLPCRVGQKTYAVIISTTLICHPTVVKQIISPRLHMFLGGYTHDQSPPLSPLVSLITLIYWNMNARYIVTPRRKKIKISTLGLQAFGEKGGLQASALQVPFLSLPIHIYVKKITVWAPSAVGTRVLFI